MNKNRSKLFEPFTPEDILANPELRYGIIKHYWLSINAFKKCCPWNGIYLNEQLLFEAIGSCYCDIYRLKIFRGIVQEDAHKQAAFLVKWISKYRPIQINPEFKQVPTSILFANEIFAISVALLVLNISPMTFWRDSQLTNYVKNLVYLLHFHPFSSPEQFASELYLLERCYKGSPS